MSGFILIRCTVHLLLFCAKTNKCTLYWQPDTLRIRTYGASKTRASTYRLSLQ